MNLLLVADEPKNLSALLEGMGAEVRCARSGEERFRRTPIIFLSAHGDRRRARAAIRWSNSCTSRSFGCA